METCLTMSLRIIAKYKNWTKSKCPLIGEWIACGLIIQWNVMDKRYIMHELVIYVSNS